MPPITPQEQQLALRYIGESFRNLRLARNISQEALAADSGVGLSTLKRLEGGRGCNLVALVQLLAALRCLGDLESFFTRMAGAGSDGEMRRRASSSRGQSPPE